MESTQAMRFFIPTALHKVLPSLCLGLVYVLTVLPASAQAPEPTTPRRPDAPALALPGPHPVGVTTVSIAHPAQIDPLTTTGKGMAPPRRDRELTVELWYPARCCADALTEYEDVLGSGPGDARRPLRPFRVQGRATRNAVPDPSVDPAPLVVLSHCYPGSRVLMSYLGEHLASRVPAMPITSPATTVEYVGFGSRAMVPDAGCSHITMHATTSPRCRRHWPVVSIRVSSHITPSRCGTSSA